MYRGKKGETDLHIAVIAPLRAGASGGAVKHLHALWGEWKRTEGHHTVTFFLPGHLDGFSGFPPEMTRTFPESDFWRGFPALRGMVRESRPDAALVINARHVDLSSVPSVVMVRNSEPLQPVDYPTSLRWKARLWYYRREHEIACRHATRILAVSEYIRRRLVEMYHLDPDRIDVVPHGLEPDGLWLPERAPSMMDPFPGSFLFTAGGLSPYRGIEDLIRAYAILTGEGVSVPPLVIAGVSNHASRDYERGLHHLADKLRVGPYLRWAGGLSREEMTWCYRRCRAFVFTSRAEACPNIVLESMGQGCVCISCDHDPMPEFYQDTAFYYPWGDATTLACQVKRTLEMSDAERGDFQARTLRRIRRFTWAKTARDTIVSLHHAAGFTGDEYVQRENPVNHRGDRDFRQCGAQALSEYRHRGNPDLFA